MTSTIFALSSGSLPSAIAVFRISGSKSLSVLQKLSKKDVWKPNLMKFTRLHNEKNAIIDEAMAVYLPGPRTFTGEDSAELFVHGSVAVSRELSKTLGRFEDVREAKRGEFTRRAFYNGKMNMNEVYGLERLIKSNSEKERRQAFGQMRGGTKAIEIRNKLEDVLGKLFIVMDFGEHVQLTLDEAKSSVREIILEIDRLKRCWKGAEIAQRGLNIILYGPPNSGKSSILNQLVHDDVAIVSPIAGTTRDSIERVAELSGIRCNLIDTAGIREYTNDKIEIIGISKARKRLKTADIVVVVIDPMTEEDTLGDLLKEVEETCNPEAKRLVVENKKDLGLPYSQVDIKSFPVVKTNATHQGGIESLRQCLTSLAEQICPETTYLLDSALLEKCQNELCLALLCSDAAIMCSHIEDGLKHVAELTTNVVSEQTLDKVFSRFCIGK